MKTILFDMDGTLIDSTRAIELSVEYAMQQGGLPGVEQKLLHSLIGKPLDEMFDAMQTPADVRADVIQSYRDKFREVGFDLTVLLPGARQAMKHARGLGTTGVVTTKTGWYTRDLLVHLCVDDLIDTVVGYEEVTLPKPNREPVDLAISRLQEMGHSIDRSNTWLVGDTIMDYGAAMSAGIRGILLTTGHGEPSSFPSGAPLADNVEAAVELIAALSATTSMPPLT